MDKEIWKDVVGYEGIYQVSNQGRVKRAAGGQGAVAGRIRRLTLDTFGYPHLLLYQGGKHKVFRVHRLVAEAFLERPSPDHNEVNHKNGDKTDNRAENLEWVTPSENMHHAYKILDRKSTPPKGAAHSNAKLTRGDVRQIRKLYKTGDHTQAELGEMFGVSQPNIGYIVRREHWKHVS
jgi:hypothetical protein